MATAQEMLNELLNLMQTPSEEGEDRFDHNVTGILYGESGGGKTITMLKLAQKIRLLNDPSSKILMLDAVNAIRSVYNHPELMENLTRIPYQGKAQLDTIVQAIEAKAPGFDTFSVVILDEVSAMADMDGEVVLAYAVKNDTRGEKDPDVLTQPDMGKTTSRMLRSITKLLKLNVSVLMVAHQRNDLDKAKGFEITRPRFMPKFSGVIREGLDFVAHMSATEQISGSTISYTRRLQCHPSKTVVAKTRVGGLQLFETPDNWIEGVGKWLNREVGDSNVNVVVNDKLMDTTELTDFSDNVID